MNCQYFRRHSYQWLDGEVENALQGEFEAHMKSCVSCQKELKEIQAFNTLLQASGPAIEASPNFEGVFWNKVLERSNEPWFSKVFRSVESWVPIPSLAQALAILLFALFIGGTGGVLSAMSVLPPKSIEGAGIAVKYLSGFEEFKGVPSPSVAATYLKAIEKGSEN